MDSAEATPMAAVGDQVAFVRSCEDRFWVRVDRTGGAEACWPWTVSFSERGYGRVTLSSGGRQLSVATHRVAYMLGKGAIPDGWEIDHLCENRSCSNPAHLEAVTREENARRYRTRHPAVGSIEYREYASGPRWRVRFRENGKNRAVTFLSEQAAVEYQEEIEGMNNTDSAQRITLTGFVLARIAEDEQPTTHRRPRVLAECEAKRRIVDLCIVAMADGRGDAAADLLDAVRALASVYKEHPDYRQGWEA